MDRSRSNRYYNPEPYPRPEKRYDGGGNYRRGAAVTGVRNFQDSNVMLTTSYRILCHDIKVGGVIGKSGSIIKSIRQNTGAWINVHELIPGDEERIIEITDTRRRDLEERMSAFSPAQEALFLIHERILESEVEVGGFNQGEYEMRVVTRLVVSKMHVGSLLGKGGKIIEQMRMETRTHIRVLPRDHNLPRCVAMSEEIVQIVGDMNAVKHALTIISSRIRESQHRDRTNFHGRLPSPERFFPPNDDYVPHMHPMRRPSMEEPSFESRLSANLVGARRNNYPSLQSADTMVSGSVPKIGNSQPFSGEYLVFQILCPVDKIDSVVGESNGIIELLQTEIGVAVKVIDPVVGADEQIIIISSKEGPDDELFPAQEALLHIQTRIVDLVPDKENIITTRLLVPSGEIGCLEGNNGLLSEMRKSSGVNVQILPNEQRPVCASGNDELLQIEGEIKVAREALVEVTSILRNHLYQEYIQKGMPTLSTSAPSPVGSAFSLEAASSHNATGSQKTFAGNNLRTASSQSVHNAATTKDFGGSVTEAVKRTENERHEDVPTSLKRFHGPLVTRSILDVVIPQHAVPKLLSKSKNKLSQISELSGATVKFIEDGPEATDNVIQISGTPEQAERAQSLLRGFILSTQEDGI